MEKVKQKLVESGVIGDVVNSFSPRVQLYLVYGQKRISLGDTLPLDVVQSKPDDVECESDDGDLEMKDILNKYKFVMVMTDPHRTPGCEYLHWLITDYNATKSDGRVIPWQELVPYEPPSSMVTRKIVFTLFCQNQSSAPKRTPRVLFSTRVFATANALGSPLGAAFYSMKDENDDQKDENEHQKENKSEEMECNLSS